MEWIAITETVKPDYNEIVFIYFGEGKPQLGMRKSTDASGDHYLTLGGGNADKNRRTGATHFIRIPEIPK